MSMEYPETFMVEICRGENRECPFLMERNISNLKQDIEKLMFRLDFDSEYRKKNPGMILRHNIFTITVSGCPNGCSQPQIKDIGIILRLRIALPDHCRTCGSCVKFCPEGALSLNREENGIEIDRRRCINCGSCSVACSDNLIVPQKSGYGILIGGRLGRHPQLAVEMITFLDDHLVMQVLEKLVMFFLENSKQSEKMAHVVNRVGLQMIRSAVIDSCCVNA